MRACGFMLLKWSSRDWTRSRLPEHSFSKVIYSPLRNCFKSDVLILTYLGRGVQFQEEFLEEVCSRSVLKYDGLTFGSKHTSMLLPYYGTWREKYSLALFQKLSSF